MDKEPDWKRMRWARKLPPVEGKPHLMVFRGVWSTWAHIHMDMEKVKAAQRWQARMNRGGRSQAL